MKNRTLLVGVALLAIGIIAGALHQTNASGENPAPQPAKVSVASAAILPPVERVPEKTEIVSASTGENSPAAPALGKIPATKPAKIPAPPKEPIQDPDARAALGFVGADPGAEVYWLAAINDPALPANERKDLIEDLNEAGLADPKHPGPQDMPLIASRIRLLEEIGPFAMDPVNADAFDEAYKDLVNLASGGTAQ